MMIDDETKTYLLDKFMKLRKTTDDIIKDLEGQGEEDVKFFLGNFLILHLISRDIVEKVLPVIKRFEAEQASKAINE